MTRRCCDVCGFYRQRPDGSPAVRRYGLSVQEPTGGRRPDGQRAYSTAGAGGLDLCDECWSRLAKPKMLRRVS